jgi:hypothetical protein
VQAQLEKQIDEAVRHVHDPLNGLSSAVVPGQKIEFFHQLVVNVDGTLKSQNQQHHVHKNSLLRSKRRRSRGFLRERQS